MKNIEILNEVEKTPVEISIMGQIEKIRVANNLKDKDSTYKFLIENWYMFDAHWLSMITHMKQTGRFL